MANAAAEIVLRNLQHAFHMEVNAHARYVAFAAQAEQEGYMKLADLFRAAAGAEKIHARNHAVVIKAMGTEPRSEFAVLAVGGSHANLLVAIHDEVEQRDVIYPQFAAEAGGHEAALRTFRYALVAESGHARLFQKALERMQHMRKNHRYWICSVCGYTAERMDDEACPSCESFWPSLGVVQVQP